MEMVSDLFPEDCQVRLRGLCGGFFRSGFSSSKFLLYLGELFIVFPFITGTMLNEDSSDDCFVGFPQVHRATVWLIIFLKIKV